MADQDAGEVVETEGAAEGGADLGSLDKLTSTFDGFKSDVMGRLDALSQRIPEPAAQEEEEPDDSADFDFEFEDEDYAENGDLTQEAQMRALRQMMTQVAQEQMAPHLERQQDERRASEADDLEKRYPELRKDEVQDEMIAKTVAFARKMGAPALAQEPLLLEMVYLAAEAQKRAGDEIPAGSEQDVQLERSAAAGGNGASEEDDGDSIVAAMRKSHFRL